MRTLGGTTWLFGGPRSTMLFADRLARATRWRQEWPRAASARRDGACAAARGAAGAARGMTRRVGAARDARPSRSPVTRRVAAFAAAGSRSPVAALLDVAQGQGEVDVFNALTSGSLDDALFFDIRLPRAAAGVVAGVRAGRRRGRAAGASRATRSPSRRRSASPPAARWP